MTAALYIGETVHQRLAPKTHRFRYRLFQLLLDVDRIDEDLKGLGLIRRGPLGLFSFDERDHGWRDGRPLRGWVEARLAETGVTASAHRIRLLTFPRVLGFVFNPISLIYVEDPAGGLEAVIYEVNNTFGQTHAYVAPAAGQGPQRQSAAKRLFVSPFFGVDGEYRFLVTPPGETLTLSIARVHRRRADFTATLSAERHDLTDRRLLALFFGLPLLTLKVVAAIHWQALRLWLRGVPLVPRPPGPDVGASAATLRSRAMRESDVSLPATEGSSDDPDRPDAGLRPAAS